MSVRLGNYLIAGSIGVPAFKTITNGKVELIDNTILRGETLTSLEITVPATISNQFICEVDFTSGTSATAFTAPANIKWRGDDTDSGALVPVGNSRYVLIFFFDGVDMRGISQKVGA